jgi:pyruvate dehydrogenase E1 component alpha subunit
MAPADVRSDLGETPGVTFQEYVEPVAAPTWAAPAHAGMVAAAAARELAAYRAMLLIRRFEEKAGQLYGLGAISGFCQLCIGQEAAIVGLHMASKPGDQMITGSRSHGHMLARGLDPKRVMAELTGRRSGYSRGKGGSMHMFSRDQQFFGGHGMVGASVPLGAGIAFANKYRGTDHVCFCSFGDDAVHQGQVYEAFRLAALWKLPVVFVIETIRDAAPQASEPVSPNLSQRGQAFAIPGEQVDGMDVRVVKAAGDRGVERVRAGNGPYILEMITQQYRGHAASPASYGSRAEDPIERARVRILTQAYASDADLKDIDRSIRDQVNAAAEFAQSDAEPDARELWTDVVA